MPDGTSTIDRLKEEARAKWDKLTDEDFDSLKSDLSNLAERLQARYDLSADEAARQAEELIGAAQETASDAYGLATAAVKRTVRRVDHAVRDNSWATIGIALLLGVTIGYLSAAERRRH